MDSNCRAEHGEDEILKRIRENGLLSHFALLHLEETASTQDCGWELLRNGESGAIVIADRQLAGRGRCGRRWHGDVKGNVYMSIAVGDMGFNCDVSAFAFQFAARIAEMFFAEFSIPLAVKAPNDLMLDGKKVGGILVETAKSMAVVGIGINLVGDENLQSHCAQPVDSIGSLKQLAVKDVATHICAVIAAMLL
jgi:BirA family biotin operon repressor/biotin-[acetyl-CoA-carboxylase] ligase